ncbi:MAG: hypothetical protein DME52_08470 [Verrucomicrobia bacterium]|nr:MAG: hypothetical protein DME52_08470 [Verrucomicrobiota bacterium]
MKPETFSTVLAFLIMSALFSPGQTPSGAETGIEGVITISPTQAGPVRDDSPPSRPLANAAFAVENEKGEVASFTTDAQGHFRTSVPPGHYKVSMKGRKSSIGRFGPFEVDVVAGKMTKVQWECDSGIR